MRDKFKIYCKEKLDTTSIENLLLDYFDNRCPETYSEDGELQCESECNRSFYDLLALVSYYFDKDHDELEIEVAYTLIKLLKEDKINSIYCTTINKVTFVSNKLHYYWNYNSFNNNSYNKAIGVDELSFDMIDKLSKEYKTIKI
jgi:hypothetical protein